MVLHSRVCFFFAFGQITGPPARARRSAPHPQSAGGRLATTRARPLFMCFAEREFPALLVVWAYQESNCISEEECTLLSRVSAKTFGVFFSVFWGCFCAFWGCFCAFWGCFCAFGVFFAFRASARFFYVSWFFRPTTPKRGIPALVLCELAAMEYGANTSLGPRRGRRCSSARGVVLYNKDGMAVRRLVATAASSGL